MGQLNTIKNEVRGNNKIDIRVQRIRQPKGGRENNEELRLVKDTSQHDEVGEKDKNFGGGIKGSTFLHSWWKGEEKKELIKLSIRKREASRGTGVNRWRMKKQCELCGSFSTRTELREGRGGEGTKELRIHTKRIARGRRPDSNVFPKQQGQVQVAEIHAKTD